MPDILKSERLVLCRPGPQHEDAMIALWRDAETARYMGGPKDAAGAWTVLSAFCGQWLLDGFGNYAVHLRADVEGGIGPFQGTCGLWFPDEWPEIEVGYALLPEARGRGIAREAASLVRDKALQRGVPSLVSYIDPRNRASQRVVLAMGAWHDATIQLRGESATVFRHAPQRRAAA